MSALPCRCAGRRRGDGRRGNGRGLAVTVGVEVGSGIATPRHPVRQGGASAGSRRKRRRVFMQASVRVAAGSG